MKITKGFWADVLLCVLLPITIAGMFLMALGSVIKMLGFLMIGEKELAEDEINSI